MQRQSETKDDMFRSIYQILTLPLGTNSKKSEFSNSLGTIPLLRVFLLSFLLVSATTPIQTIVPHEELVVQLNCPELTPDTINTVNLLGCGATMMSTRHDRFRYEMDGKSASFSIGLVMVGIPTGNFYS